MIREDQAYQEMLSVAKIRLSGKKASILAENAGALMSASSLFVHSLGSTYEMYYPTFECHQDLDPLFHLILLHYLALADGYPVSLEPMSFGDLGDGLIRGVKFDREAERDLERILSGRTPDEIVAGLKAIGAYFVESNADLCAVLTFFPNYPMILNIWYADDEFPASGKLFVTQSADHYLTMEDALAIGGFVLSAFNTELLKMAALNTSGENKELCAGRAMAIPKYAADMVSSIMQQKNDLKAYRKFFDYSYNMYEEFLKKSEWNLDRSVICFEFKKDGQIVPVASFKDVTIAQISKYVTGTLNKTCPLLFSKSEPGTDVILEFGLLIGGNQLITVRADMLY